MQSHWDLPTLNNTLGSNNDTNTGRLVLLMWLCGVPVKPIGYIGVVSVLDETVWAVGLTATQLRPSTSLLYAVLRRVCQWLQTLQFATLGFIGVVSVLDGRPYGLSALQQRRASTIICRPQTSLPMIANLTMCIWIKDCGAQLLTGLSFV